jgi:hypothetical protein
MMEKGERRVRETSINDGYSWRKYGQKEILGAQHPRLVLKHFRESLTFSRA